MALLIDEASELALLKIADDSAALVAELTDDFFDWTFSVFGAVVFFIDLLAFELPHAASEKGINTAADPSKVVLTDLFINNISFFSIFIEKTIRDLLWKINICLILFVIFHQHFYIKCCLKKYLNF